jgi:hypothetical protein
MSLFIHIAIAILYPVTFHFTYKFWIYIINFYSQIFDLRDDSNELTPEIVNAMYTANIFLILPIGGALLSTFAQVYFLFRGVSTKLNFSKTQAFLVLLTPLFILFIVSILIVSYFVFLLSLI